MATASLVVLSLLVATANGHGPAYNSVGWNEHGRTKLLHRHKRSSVLGVNRGGHVRTVRPVSYRQPYRRPDYSSKLINVEDFKKDQPKARLWQINPRRRKPGRYSLTSRLVAINIICYVIQTISPRFTQAGIKLSDRILRGEQLYRLLTPVFLHGGVAHLAMVS